MRVLENKIHCHSPSPEGRDPDVLPATTAAVAAVERDFRVSLGLEANI
jgi:hypothetical protein